MRLKFLLTLKLLLTRGKTDELVRYSDRLSDDVEKEVCEIASAVLEFSARENTSAQHRFARAYAFFRNRSDGCAEYLRLYCLVHLSLLRRSVGAAAAHARAGRSSKPPMLVKSIFPMPDLEEKVLYQNTIEATG